MSMPIRDAAPRGHALRLGIAVTPNAADYPQIVEQVLAAERGGLDVVGIQDHPYQRRYLDTFALIADLLARTSRLRLFPDVASLPMRPPTMLAKAAASLDVMSGGRFELGIGAGNFWDAVAGMAGTTRAPGDRIAALEEAVAVIRAALDVGSERGVVRGPGPHVPVPGYPAGPPPAHRVEIWIGAMAPRTLRLIGRLADGWVPAAGTQRIADFGTLGAHIDEAAVAAGRDPASIRRIVNIGDVVRGGAAASAGAEDPRDVADRLVGWALTHRIDTFVHWSSEPGSAWVERFAHEVAPRVREELAGG